MKDYWVKYTERSVAVLTGLFMLLVSAILFFALQPSPAAYAAEIANMGGIEKVDSSVGTDSVFHGTYTVPSSISIVVDNLEMATFPYRGYVVCEEGSATLKENATRMYQVEYVCHLSSLTGEGVLYLGSSTQGSTAEITFQNF